MSTNYLALSATAALRYLRDAGVDPEAVETVLSTVPVAARWTDVRQQAVAYYYPRDLDAAVAFVKKD